MSNRVALALMLVIGMAVSAGAQVPVPSFGTVRGEVAFDGRGTLGGFTGRTTRISGRLTGGSSVENVRGWVEALAASLTTGIGKRDRDMWSSLDVQKFPVIRFDLDDVAIGPMAGDSIPITMRGRFTIHGVMRETAVRGWAHVTAQRVRFHGRAPMSLHDYDIGGLSKAFGLLKMDPDIVVRMDITFEG